MWFGIGSRKKVNKLYGIFTVLYRESQRPVSGPKRHYRKKNSMRKLVKKSYPGPSDLCNTCGP